MIGIVRYEDANERKFKIMDIIRSLDLSNNPLDDIIDQVFDLLFNIIFVAEVCRILLSWKDCIVFSVYLLTKMQFFYILVCVLWWCKPWSHPTPPHPKKKKKKKTLWWLAFIFQYYFLCLKIKCTFQLFKLSRCPIYSIILSRSVFNYLNFFSL